MTLVQYFVNFLRPYVELPEFTSCVMKALEKLDHPVSGGLACEWKSGSFPEDNLTEKVQQTLVELETYCTDCDD